jgi:flagellar biosynthesis anti-sigma factor FlgM
MKKTQLSSCQSEDDLAAVERKRAARVKAIKQAVASGTYQVDESALANRLLSHLLCEEWLEKYHSKPE